MIKLSLYQKRITLFINIYLKKHRSGGEGDFTLSIEPIKE